MRLTWGTTNLRMPPTCNSRMPVLAIETMLANSVTTSSIDDEAGFLVYML